MICKTSHIRRKIYQSGASAMAGTTGKDLATFRHAKTWESRKTSFPSTASPDQDVLLY